MTEPAAAAAAADSGIEIEIAYDLEVDGEYLPGSDTEARIDSVNPHGADVVVFQRPSNHSFPQAIELLKKMGVAVVVEIDDLMHGVSTRHAMHSELVGQGSGNRILQCARLADMVTVSTPALQRVYGSRNASRVIPNAIPRRIAEMRPAYDRSSSVGPVTIGWTGSVFTHPHDLEQMGSGLRTALDRHTGQARFTIFGQSEGARGTLGLRDSVAEIMWLPDVEGYLSVLGQQFDIGVAPLRVDKFNAAKSWLKPLEYAARGVYPIRSVIDEYDRLGIGRYAKNPKDWAREISRAVADPDMRHEFARAEHERVLASHLTEHTAERWIEAWRSAADLAARDRRRGAVPC